MDTEQAAADALAGVIPKSVYPLLPDKMKAPGLTQRMKSDISESRKPGQHVLGVKSGRNPLFAFNALIVKLMTVGSLLAASDHT